MAGGRRLGLAVAATALLVAAPLSWNRYQDERLTEQARAALTRGLEFLSTSQLETGEFPTYAWSEGEQARATYVRTPFTASQILHSLTFVEGGEVGRRLREQLTGYLLSHRESPGVWRYYGRDDGYYAQVYVQFRHPKLPPDVDDTAQAWAALSEQGLAVDPAALEALRANRTASALFNTWIAPQEELAWMDSREREVDLVVNLNALFLFARVGQPLPEVCQHLTAATKTTAFHRGTVWYPAPLAYAYFLSRAYADGRAICLAEAAAEIHAYAATRQRTDGGWGDDLETALGVLTLLNTGEQGTAVRRAIRALVTRQGSDGGWQMAPLYKGAVLYYGSRPLTTAFCLEALAKYVSREASVRRNRPPAPPPPWPGTPGGLAP